MRGQSQGSISQQLRKLETVLGVQLIERHAQGCVPTPDGAAFVDYAESLLRLNERVMDVFRVRCIAIGVSSNIGIYLFQPYIKDYFGSGDTQPEIRIDTNPVVARKLATCEIDIAAMEWWDGRPGYMAYPWRREPLVAVVPPGHPWAALSHVPSAELRRATLLGGEPGTGTGRLLARYCGEHGSSLKLSKQLGSTEAVKRWVRAGLGVSVMLAGTVAEECHAGSLVAVPLEGEPLSKELYVVWRESLAVNHPARVFGEWLAGRDVV